MTLEVAAYAVGAGAGLQTLRTTRAARAELGAKVAAQRRGRSGEVASLVERRVAAQIRGPITARSNWAQDGARKFIARQTAPPRARSRARNAEWEMGR